MSGDIAPVAPVALDEVKAFLRLDGSTDDALLAGFVRTATGLAEAFTGQRLIVRDIADPVGTDMGWQRLRGFPVVAITGVDGADAFEVDIDLGGSGWVRVTAVAGAQPVARYRAGLAADWNGVPEPLRQGIVRLVAHLYAHRDAADAGGAPAAVAALWRPYRRVRL